MPAPRQRYTSNWIPACTASASTPTTWTSAVHLLNETPAGSAQHLFPPGGSEATGTTAFTLDQVARFSAVRTPGSSAGVSPCGTSSTPAASSAFRNIRWIWCAWALAPTGLTLRYGAGPAPYGAHPPPASLRVKHLLPGDTVSYGTQRRHPASFPHRHR